MANSLERERFNKRCSCAIYRRPWIEILSTRGSRYVAHVCVCVCVCVLFVCHLLEELQETARSHGEFMPTKDISQSFAVAELQKFSLSHFVRNLRNGEIQESRFPRFSERVTRAQQRSVVICTVHSL